MSEKIKKPLTKKKKVWILVAALSVVLAAAVTAGALILLPGRNPADPQVRWYNTEDKEFVIDSVDELYDLAYLSTKYNFEGQTIKLGADIIINDGDASTWGENAPSRLWYPIANFNGTFDGQGHTISGLYGVSFNQEMGLFSFTGKDAVVTNLRVVNTYIKSSGEHGTGIISANGGGTFENIYVDAIIRSDNWNNGGIIGLVDLNGDTLISNCWFDGEMILVSDQGRVAGGIVGDILPENGIVTIQHCLNTGKFSAEAITHTGRGRLMDIGGIVGRATSGTTNITDCFANTEIDSGCVVGAGALIGSAGKGKTNLSHSYAVKKDNISSVGYRYNQTTGDVYTYTSEYVNGYEAYKWTTLDFENFWAVDKDGTPILKTFADEVPDLSGVKRMIDTSWYTKRNTATLKTIEQVRGFQVVSQWDNFSGKTIYLGADIVVQEGDASTWGETPPEIEWKGFSSANVMFQGTFDGAGHTISGMYQKKAANGLGMFVAVYEGAIIRNLRVENSYFETNNVAVNNQTYSYIGSVAAYARGATFDSIYSNAHMASDGYFCGGIVGLMRNGKASTVTNCWFDGTVTLTGINTGMRGGGIVGCVWNTTINMSHCLNTGYMSSESWAWGANEGLMVGYPNAASKVNIEDSVCAATLMVLDGKKDGNGMFVGRVSGDAVVTFDSVFAIKTPNPKEDPDAEAQWLCNWGLTGYRDGTVECTGPALVLDEKYLTGSNAYAYTDLDFKNFWAIDEDGNLRLQTFLEDGAETLDVSNLSKAVDYSWYSSKSDLYIATREQLLALPLLSTGDTFKDKTIHLSNSITVNYGNAEDWVNYAPYYKWTPVGNADNMFQGTFDGHGYTVSGIYVSGSGNCLGFFACTRNATVKNFRLTNSFVRSNGVAVSGAKGKVSSYNYIGGIAAYAANTNFSGIYTNAIVMNDGEMCGGIVGLINKVGEPVSITNCWFDGTIKQEWTSYKKADGGIYCVYYGGLVGLLRNAELTISHCAMTGTIEGVNFPDGTWGSVAGGFIGRIDNTGTNPAPKLTITDSLADTKIAGYPSSTVGNGTVVAQCNKNAVMILKNVYAVPNTWKPVMQWQSKELGSGEVVTVGVSNLTGSKAYINADLDYNNYWSALEGKIPQLKRFASGTVAEKVAIDTSWYDDAQTEYVLTTADELLGFASLSKSNTFEGKTIKLGNDIVFNEGDASTWGETAPAKFWISVGSAASRFKGTFDGQGYTISGIYYQNEGADGTALFECIDGGTVKNFKLVNSYFDDAREAAGYAAWSRVAAVVATAYSGTVSDVYTDAYVSGGTMYNGGIVGMFRAPGTTTTAALTIENCWFDGTLDLGATGRASGGIIGGGCEGNKDYTTLTIKNCLMSGDIKGTFCDTGCNANNTYEVTSIGGVIGNIINTKVNVDGVVVTGTMDVNTESTYIGSLLGYKNYGCATGTSKNIYILDGICVQQFVNLAHNTSGATWNAVTVPVDMMLGGQARNTADGLDFTESGAWIAVEDKYPELRAFSDAEDAPIVADPNTETTEWYDAAQTEYVISTIGEMKGFITLVNSGTDFTGKTVKLGANITWNAGNASGWIASAPLNVWTPIGTADHKFTGTFDGQGYTLSGLYYKENTSKTSYGMFAYAQGATIKNLTLTNSCFFNSNSIGSCVSGALVAQASGITVENVNVTDSVYLEGATISGMIGNISGNYTSTFTNCATAINLNGIMYRKYMGGFVGQIEKPTSTTNFTNCLSTATIVVTGNGADCMAGGFIGCNGGDTKINITDSLSVPTINTNSLSSTGYIGSVIGVTAYGKNVGTMTDVYAINDNVAIGGGRVEGAAYSGHIESVKRTALLGGVARWTLSGLDFTEDGAWIAVEDKLPELRVFSDAEEAPEVEEPGDDDEPDVPTDPEDVDTTWYDGTQTEYVLDTLGKFKGFIQLSQSNNFVGKTVKLGTDIAWNTLEDGETTADWATTAPANAWTPIGNSSVQFAGTFDAQGYTISGLYYKATARECIGLFSYTNGATIKNLVMDDCFIDGGGFYTADPNFASAGTVAGYATNTNFQTIHIGDGVIITHAQDMGGIAGQINGTANPTFDKCWFSGTIKLTTEPTCRAGGIYAFGYRDARNIVLTDCLFDGTITGSSTTGDTYAGGLFSMGNYANSATIARCVVVGTVDAVTTKGTGSVTALTAGGGNMQYNDVYYLTGTTAMTNPGTMKAGSVITPVEKSALLGDEAKTTLAGFNFVNVWVAVDGSTPILKGYEEVTLSGITVTAPSKTTYEVGESLDTAGMVVKANYSDSSEATLSSDDYTITGFNSSIAGEFTVTVTYSGKTATFMVTINEPYVDPTVETTAWYDGSKTEYTISTIGELKGFVTLAATEDFTGVTIKLGDDIAWNTLSEGEKASDWATTAPANTWTPISGFTGTFDGDNHTISGLYVNGEGPNGMFATVTGATIKNLTLTDSCIINPEVTLVTNGILVGEANGVTIENVKVAETVTLTGGTNLGLVGYGKTAAAITFKQVWMAGTVTTGNATARIGGLLGYVDNTSGLTITIENCLFTGVVNYTVATGNTTRYAGGFLGQGRANVVLTITDSVSAGTVNNSANSKVKTGSIAGDVSSTASRNTFTDVYATTECYSAVCSRATTGITQVAEADLKGDSALTTASGLDFVETWVVVEGEIPALKIFSE